MSERPLSRYAAVMGFCVLAGMIAGGLSAALGDLDGVGPVIVGGAFALAMAVCFWVCIGWWRSLDEAAREAHKWAWWWGSTAGLAIGSVALYTLVYSAPEALTASPKDLLLGGAGFVVLVQTLGYAVAWAFWWLKRR
ncbi:MAG: hypothetical protein IM674_09460 [Brevundimonas sp.]|nr:hypothetical protein [Brevundimonas sp.]